MCCGELFVENRGLAVPPAGMSALHRVIRFIRPSPGDVSEVNASRRDCLILIANNVVSPQYRIASDRSKSGSERNFLFVLLFSYSKIKLRICGHNFATFFIFANWKSVYKYIFAALDE